MEPNAKGGHGRGNFKGVGQEGEPGVSFEDPSGQGEGQAHSQAVRRLEELKRRQAKGQLNLGRRRGVEAEIKL
jgi:hypothetical protein